MVVSGVVRLSKDILATIGRLWISASVLGDGVEELVGVSESMKGGEDRN